MQFYGMNEVQCGEPVDNATQICDNMVFWKHCVISAKAIYLPLIVVAQLKAGRPIFLLVILQRIQSTHYQRNMPYFTMGHEAFAFVFANSLTRKIAVACSAKCFSATVPVVSAYATIENRYGLCLAPHSVERNAATALVFSAEADFTDRRRLFTVLRTAPL